MTNRIFQLLITMSICSVCHWNIGFVAHDWFLPEQEWLRFYRRLAQIKKWETTTFTSWNYTLLHVACVKFRAMQHVLNETRSPSESQDSRTFPSSITLPLYPCAQHFAFSLVHPSFTKALLVHWKQNTVWGGEVVIWSKYNRGNGIIRQGIMIKVFLGSDRISMWCVCCGCVLWIEAFVMERNSSRFRK